jgi:hypothetical protein
MRADYGVVLDTCLFLPIPLADSLLRMADEPRHCVPKWSDDIIQELRRNFVSSLGRSEQQAEHRIEQMNRALTEQAESVGTELDELLGRLPGAVPGF